MMAALQGRILATQEVTSKLDMDELKAAATEYINLLKMRPSKQFLGLSAAVLEGNLAVRAIILARADGHTGEVGEWILMTKDKTDAEGYLNRAWDLLDEQQQKEAADTLHKALLKSIREPATDTRIRAMVQAMVAELTTLELGERLAELRSRVATEVSRRWDEAVTSTVSKQLADAIAKIKAEMSR
jgi:hypothetical protein